MTEITETILIRANLNKVYSIASDYPLFVRFFSKKEIIESDDAKSWVRVTNNFCCIPLSWEGRGEKTKNQKICWVQTKGLLDGLKAEWTFSGSVEDTTMVTATAVYPETNIKRKVLSYLAPVLIRKATRKIFIALKEVAER